jgi:hypothetical protein
MQKCCEDGPKESVYFTTNVNERKWRDVCGVAHWVCPFERVQAVYEHLTNNPPTGRETHVIRTVSVMLHDGTKDRRGVGPFPLTHECIHKDLDLVGESLDLYAVLGGRYKIRLYRPVRGGRKEVLPPLEVEAGQCYSLHDKYRSKWWHAVDWDCLKWCIRVGYDM